MAENQLIIGSLPVLRGAYDAGTSYYRDNQVTMYGSTFQSLTDGNMGYPPAELREDGKVYAINTDKWIIVANAIEAYNAGERISALEATFSQEENPEYVSAVVDAEGRVLFGLTAEGRPYFPKNDTYRVASNEEWLTVWLDTAGHVLFGIRADGSTYVAKSEFQDTLSRIEALLTESGVDGTDLKAAIAALQADVAPLAETFGNVESPEGCTEMTLDADGKVLGYRDKDGVRHENLGMDMSRLLVGGKEKDFVDRSELFAGVSAAADSGAIALTQVTGVSNHDTPNLLIPSEMEKTFNDGVNSFTPPNEGYEMSNPIECRAGDWFTRTGTATGMVVVTDENDKNGKRLFNADGTTLGNTFQVPADMTWVRYIRMAADKAAAQDGGVVICRGKEAYTDDEQGDFVTIPNLRVEKRNLSRDVLYVASEDGTKYYVLYVDSSGVLQVREVDQSVIPENQYPVSWKALSLTGSFSGYFDRFTIMNDRMMIDLKSEGPVRIKETSVPITSTYGNFEHFYTESGAERYVVASDQEVVSDGKGITIFDGGFNVIDTNIPQGDIHDFVYFADDHLIRLGSHSAEIELPGQEAQQISGVAIWEMRKRGGVWLDVAHFYATDYPALCTDAFGNKGGVIDSHPNTVGLDYDGNILLNMRNWDTFLKIRRVEGEDGVVTLGSATKDYDEAIIGRVGGRHNSGYIDSKRVLNEGFSFTDVPQGLTEVSADDWEEWQWFHCHDVKYWGMKEIGGKQYPTYTLFDNNYWTGYTEVPHEYNADNRHNGAAVNPNGGNENYYLTEKDGNEAYAKHNVSRVVQLSVDWEQHRIVDYRVYVIPKCYAKTQSGATMYKEGIISIAYSHDGRFGLWDFTTEDTKVEGHVYTGARQLFLGEYGDYRYCYRANTYKKN